MAKTLKASTDYNSSEVRNILENLELLTHKSTEEAQKMLNQEGKHKKKNGKDEQSCPDGQFKSLEHFSNYY